MRVVLLGHAATTATRTAAFPGDEPLEPAGYVRATALAGTLPRTERAYRAPSQRCAATAEAVGLSAVAAPELAGCDFGRWTGRTWDSVFAEEPEAARQWLTDPSANPHGGESLLAVRERVGRWLDEVAERDRAALIAVCDPTVIRAAVVHAIDARPRSMWRIDIAPLAQVTLTGEPGRWSLRSVRQDSARQDPVRQDGEGGS